MVCSAVDEMPEMSEVFLRYRELKKQLKRMPHVGSSSTLQEGQPSESSLVSNKLEYLHVCMSVIQLLLQERVTG